MTSDISLSEGICQRLNSGDKDDESLWNSKPTLQFLSIKKVVANSANGATNNANSTIDRYRIIISDGLYFLQAMLATQLNFLVEDDRIGKNTIAVVENMSCQYIMEKRLVIILGLRVLQRDGPKIGNPAPLAVPPPQSKPDDVPPQAVPSAPAPAPYSATSQPQNRQAMDRANPIYPIVALTPYQNNWRIKARVLQKSDIRHYSNQRGEGRLFSVTLMDDSGEIKGTVWNAMVDELFEKLQETRVYFVSKARVNLAKKKFSTIQNDYELSLDRGTEIEECHDGEYPEIRYNFVDLLGLRDLQKDAVCDVLVVVKEVGDLAEIMTRNNKMTQKRDLVVVDQTKYSTRLTLWGKQAEQFGPPAGSVVAFKGVRISDFNGVSLSLLSSGSVGISPDIAAAHALKGWYSDAGAQASFNSHTQAGSSGAGGAINRNEMLTIHQVKDTQLGMSDKADFFSMRATVMHIKTENMMYPACPTPQCNKKVIESHDGWRCEKCDRSYEKPEYRYIIQVATGDHTSQIWLSGFNDVGITLFGMTGDELRSLQEENEAKANRVILSATCKGYNFACRASQHTFNDQSRVRYGIQKMQPLDYHAESQALLALLQSPWAK